MTNTDNSANFALSGHLAAGLTIFIWGTTFISTKVLLSWFSPADILFFRFSLGFLALCLTGKRPIPCVGLRQECLFALAGLLGVTLYFLLENIALTYTLASNVGVLISISPFFTAMLALRFLNGEKLGKTFFLGLLAALSGICLISVSGSSVLQLNPLGDFLALMAALCWSCYSILTRKIGELGCSVIQTTRRTFFYGLLFMTPALFLMDFQPARLLEADLTAHLNLIYLGLGASALCFVTWNTAVKRLGAVKTSVYIYAVPVITVVTSAVVLQEPITILAAAGTALTLIGLILSEGKHKRYESNRKECHDH